MQVLHGQTVATVDGCAASDARARSAFAQDVALLGRTGIHPVVIEAFRPRPPRNRSASCTPPRPHRATHGHRHAGDAVLNPSPRFRPVAMKTLAAAREGRRKRVNIDIDANVSVAPPVS
ncbi:hypothetical protein [Burkholderia sp. MSMB1826]|uniref:hypothetical protein n=1 Tax=Burkholderia sp. MSMB1826 TaxID=1637875 RepID=UPI0015CF8D3D|nr:hypothetical protein [Burkholderia sp. MSMB1826]